MLLCFLLVIFAQYFLIHLLLTSIFTINKFSEDINKIILYTDIYEDIEFRISEVESRI